MNNTNINAKLDIPFDVFVVHGCTNGAHLLLQELPQLFVIFNLLPPYNMHLIFFCYIYQQTFLKAYIIIGDMVEDLLRKLNKDNFYKYSKLLSNLSPLEFSTLGCIIAITLINTLNPNEQNTIGNLLEMIGQILLTNYAQASTVDPNATPISECDFNSLKKEVDKIKNKIIKLSQNQNS